MTFVYGPCILPIYFLEYWGQSIEIFKHKLCIRLVLLSDKAVFAVCISSSVVRRMHVPWRMPRKSICLLSHHVAFIPGFVSVNVYMLCLPLSSYLHPMFLLLCRLHGDRNTVYQTNDLFEVVSWEQLYLILLWTWLECSFSLCELSLFFLILFCFLPYIWLNEKFYDSNLPLLSIIYMILKHFSYCPMI